MPSVRQMVAIVAIAIQRIDSWTTQFILQIKYMAPRSGSGADGSERMPMTYVLPTPEIGPEPDLVLDLVDLGRGTRYIERGVRPLAQPS